MYKYSEKSLNKLNTCHPDLQKLFKEAIKYMDIIILEGHRGKDEQNRAYKNGFSKLQYPKSKHNKIPSLAVDAAPYPVNYNDKNRFYLLAGLIKGLAIGMDITIRWGGDWDNDGDIKDNKFNDLPHYELVL